MVRLDCSGARFGSQLDEKHQFPWVAEIPGFLRWDQDTLIVRSLLSEASLRDFLSLFSRYEIPMKQLTQFKKSKTVHGFGRRIYTGTPKYLVQSNLMPKLSGRLRRPLSFGVSHREL